MRITKVTATAVLAIGATAVAAGTAYAQPVENHPAAAAHVREAAPRAVAGVDHGVAYHTTLSADGRSIVSTIDAGSFRLSADRKTITVNDAQGRVFGVVPTGVRVGDARLAFAPSVSASGDRLTLTPIGQQLHLKDINSQQWFFYELQRASLGALVGGIIGFAVGVLGFFVGAIPGAVIGAIIGELVAGGQPLIDAGFAYFSGRP
jgi:hypothetical protein